MHTPLHTNTSAVGSSNDLYRCQSNIYFRFFFNNSLKTKYENSLKENKNKIKSYGLKCSKPACS